MRPDGSARWISGYGSVDDYIKAMLAEKGVNPYQPQIVPQPVQGH